MPKVWQNRARMPGERGTGTFGGREDQKSVWSFFDAYKVSGEGASVVRPELRSFRHVSEESMARDVALLAKKQGRPSAAQPGKKLAAPRPKAALSQAKQVIPFEDDEKFEDF